MASDMAPGTRLHVRVLGGFSCSVNGQEVAADGWRLGKARDVVKILALSPGRHLLRDQVLEMLWPERDPDSASNNLHQVMHSARKAITNAGGDGHSVLRMSHETLSLEPDDIWVDADAFEEAARDAMASEDPEACRRALDLYQGELLPEDRYADWAQARRQVLQRLYLDLMALRSRHLEAEGNLGGSADVLRLLLVDDPMNESAHRNLMRIYALTGDRNAAVRQFEQLETALWEELGVAPDAATVALHEDIAAGELAPARPPPPTNLGARLSSFIGRARELAELPDQLATSRTVTLVGPGGCGKTRLALEVGRRCLEGKPGGVFAVELAAVSEAEEVPLEAARALGVRERPDETVSQAVATRIGASETLLILDNCEHVAQEVATLAADLLRACPQLTLLTTSREPLRIPGEVVRRVSSLRVPDPQAMPPVDELVEYDAVRLFVERVKAVQSDFRLDSVNADDVAELCFRLDGMPLALELAAARVPALSVAGIVPNLDDRFNLLTGGPRTALTRQQTLEATVEWSYQLLDLVEQTLFCRLSVFHGYFDLAAARSVADWEPTGGGVAVLLGELVERSMVVATDMDGSVRYRLLETMREYGRARLHRSGELGAALDSHAEWLVGLVGGGVGGPAAPQRPETMASLALAHDDLWPALDHLLVHRPSSAVRLAALLWPYWLWHAHLGEGLGLIERVLARATAASAQRAELLIGASALAVRWRGFEAMAEYAGRSLDEARTVGDLSAQCRAHLFFGLGPWCRDEFDLAESLFGEARALAEQAGLVAPAIGAILAQAMAATERRRLELAQRLLAEAEALAPGLDHDEPVLNLYTLGAWTPSRRWGARSLMWGETWVVFEEAAGRSVVAMILAARANLERIAGRLAPARALLEDALATYREADDVGGVALVLCRLGQLAFVVGDLDEATSQLEESLAIREMTGHVRGLVTASISLARVAAEREDYEAARLHLKRAESLAREHLDNNVLGVSLIEQGLLEMSTGSPSSAVAMIAEALEIGRAAGYSLHLATVLRDLGQAQLAAELPEEASKSLSEASELFDRLGYTEEADFSRGLAVT